jgi:serine/threonine protein kinase
MRETRLSTPLGQTFSAGVATWDGTESSDALTARADTIRYKAKNAGRNQIAEAEQEIASNRPEGPSPPTRGMRERSDHGRLPRMDRDLLAGGRTDRVLGGRYRLASQVGAGGMAIVWQAYDTVLARTVAVKVLAAHCADDPQSRDRIRSEAQAAAALSHPNIAQVYDYGEADVAGEVVPFIVMELIRGSSLHQRLSDGPVLPRYAMRLCAEIAAALAAAHAEGLVHRDIKPANVMLAPTGAKVVDFGIAAAIRPPGAGPYDVEVVGTPAYLAPERLLHDAVEPASDVYALGVLLYRLLAGHPPWTSETTTQMLTAHIYLEPPPLLPMFHVPASVTELCNRCLAKDPAQRPSAREAAALLAHGAGLQVITDEPPAQQQAAVDTEPSVLIRTPTDDQAGSHPETAPADPVSVPVPAGPPESGIAAAAPAIRGRRRVRYALAVVVLVVAVASTLWFLRPEHRAATVAARVPGPPRPSVAPTVSRAVVNPLPGTSTKPDVTMSDAPAPRPTGAGNTVTVLPTRGPTAPGNPAGTAPAATTPPTDPITPEPDPTGTTSAPAAEPAERTLSSAAGSVRATCPAPGTAQILSWTATQPYKVTNGETEAGPAPTVSFKHGNTQVTMTVTCNGGVPSATST